MTRVTIVYEQHGPIVGSGGMEQLANEHIIPAIKAVMRDRDLTLFKSRKGRRVSWFRVGACLLVAAVALLLLVGTT